MRKEKKEEEKRRDCLSCKEKLSVILLWRGTDCLCYNCMNCGVQFLVKKGGDLDEYMEMQ